MTENQDKKCSKRHFIAVSSTYNLKSSRHHPTMVVAIKRNRRFQSRTGRLMRKRVKREIYKRGCWRGSSKWKGKIISGSNTDKIIQLLVLVENSYSVTNGTSGKANFYSLSLFLFVHIHDININNTIVMLNQ